MVRNIANKLKKSLDDTEQIDDRFYAEVMDELNQGFKDKAAVGKAIAQCDGDESKFNSIYMKIRASTLQEQSLIYQEQTKAEDENMEIMKNREINQKNILKMEIDLKHTSGYFYKIFQDEIKENGFTRSWLPNSTFKKDGSRYTTRIDYIHMNYIIVNKKGEDVYSFNFEKYLDYIQNHKVSNKMTRNNK